MANYLKQGTNDNFLTDSAEIELAKFNNLRFSVLGYMLGDFDEHGVYTVDEGIIKELINMRKYVVSTVENVEICHSEIRLNRPITFLVTFEEDCATLSLIEKISHEGNYKENGGSVSDINEYVLDAIQTSGIINKDVVYRRWHIGEFAGTARDVASLDEETKAELLGIIGRYKYLLYMNTYMLEKEEALEEQELNYAEDMKLLLARFPKLNDAVQKEVKEKLTTKKDFVRIDKPFVARTINEIVQQAIENNISVLKSKELEAFNVEKHEILNNHNQRMAEIVQTKVEKPIVNAENSVGKVLADTEVMLPKNFAGDENITTMPKPETHFTIEELRKGLDSQRLETEERLFDEAVGAITGQQQPIVEQNGKVKQPKVNRISAVVDKPIEEHVSSSTKKQAEDIKAKKSTTNKTDNAGLIAKAVKPNTKTDAPKTASAGKTAGSGGKSAGGKSAGGGGGKGKGGEKSGGGKDKANNKKETKKDKAEAKPTITRVDPRIGKLGAAEQTANQNEKDNKQPATTANDKSTTKEEDKSKDELTEEELLKKLEKRNREIVGKGANQLEQTDKEEEKQVSKPRNVNKTVNEKQEREIINSDEERVLKEKGLKQSKREELIKPEEEEISSITPS